VLDFGTLAGTLAGRNSKCP